jgi:hypothetical protein
MPFFFSERKTSLVGNRPRPDYTPDTMHRTESNLFKSIAFSVLFFAD